MRIDTKRNNSDGTTELSFVLEGNTPIKVHINKELDVIKMTPSNLQTEFSPLNVQYYYFVFRTIVEKLQKLREQQGES